MGTVTAMLILVLAVGAFGTAALGAVANAAVATATAATAAVGRLVSTTMMVLVLLLLVATGSDPDQPGRRTPTVVGCPDLDAECTVT